MTIQDDIFDVREALKRRPEARAFARIERHLALAEENADSYGDLLRRLSVGLGALQELREMEKRT